MTANVRDWRGVVRTRDGGDVVLQKIEKSKETEQQRDVQLEYVKDEFGRDIAVPNNLSKGKERKKKKTAKRKDKKTKNTAFYGTPPPADPFRPELDESRVGRRSIKGREALSEGIGPRHRKRCREDRSRSPSSRRHSNRHKKSSHRSYSPDLSRGRSRSRSSLSHNKGSWDHSGFENQSPSPVREIDESYRPEPEPWVSRAGGVYIPRK